MRLTRRQLNRTLLLRQHLLERTDAGPHELVAHLIGLQGQDNLPPYLSLLARSTTFDPYAVTRALDDRSLVRLLTLRGTVHVLTPHDALRLRPWTQQRMDKEVRHSQNVGAARDLDRIAFLAALAEVLAAGALPQRDLGEALARSFPDTAAAPLGQLARVAAPLVQLPPRGGWKRSGSVVYDYLDRWVGRDLVPPTADTVHELVRRYLRAFGPASAADVATWSGVTGLAAVLGSMDELVCYGDAAGRVLYDVADGVLADEETPAPVRLLGTYDNVWLSHAARDRVTEPDARRAWMGANGGVASTIFVDGWLTGLWRRVDDRVEVVELVRALTRRERSELDDEIARVDTLLLTPPYPGG